jgi:hypothetical protein
MQPKLARVRVLGRELGAKAFSHQPGKRQDAAKFTN